MSVSLDANGWTAVTPSADSRVIYVSNSSGNDANSGLTASAPLKTIPAGIAMLRSGMPDWLLLKRGDSWVGEGLSSWSKSGRSAQEPMLISSYGSTGARPILKTGAYNGIYAQNVPVNYLSIIGLDFYANTRDPLSPDFVNTDGGTGIRWMVASKDLLIEDTVVRGYTTNVFISPELSGPITNVKIRRSMILDSYATVGHSAGALLGGLDGLLLEGNVFDHNGWNENIVDAPADKFNHNIYIVSNNTGVVVKDNIIANAASHGLQARSGGQISGNIFLNNPIDLSFGMANGSAETSGGVSGFIKDNIFAGSRDIDGSLRGYVMEIGNLKPGGTIVSGNIMVGDAKSLSPAIQISEGVYLSAPSGNTGVNDLTIENNVLYNWASAIWVDSRLVPGTTGALGLNNLTVRNNDFQKTSDPQIITHSAVFKLAQEHFSGNRYYSTQPASNWFSVTAVPTSFTAWKATYEPTAANTQVAYPDSTRTIGSYNASLGGLASFSGYITEARKQSKVNWRTAYASAAVADYFQHGYNASVPAVIATPTSPLQTSEAGGTATFQVILSIQPAANVLVPFSSSNTGEGTVSSSLLTFTPANWNVPQTITVTGVDDNIINQDATYTVIIGATQSIDVNYNALDAADLTLINKALVPLLTLTGTPLSYEATNYSLGLSALNMGTVTSWSINWGDGPAQFVNGNPSSISHTYADNGSYTITATATSSGGSANASKVLTVNNIPPTLTITGAASSNEASPYTLNLSSYDPGPDAITSWRITWGDGVIQTVTGNPAAVTHTFADSGSYTITATATDEDDTYNTNTKAVTVNNIAPTLALSGAGTVNQNSPYAVNFTVTDPGADTISAWNINWGDGQTSPLAGAARSASHTYLTAGTFTITLTATDEDGSYSITGSVGVADSGGASISGPATTSEAASYTLLLSTTNSSPLSWLINWGDGPAQFVGGNPASVIHTYADDGAYTITATLTASSGSYSTTKNITVNNVAPTLTLGGAASANEGSLYSLNLSSSDVAPDTIASWRIIWGDGNIQTITGNPSSITHTFADNGPYTITATATDEDGAYSASGKSVTISKVDPILNLSGNGTVNQGAPYSVGFSITDPGADTVSSWTLNWGDGQTSPLAGSARSASHTYSTTGAFTITLTATDEDGSYSITRGVNVVAASGGVSISGATTSNEAGTYSLLLNSGSASPASWSVTWGDGATESATGALITLTHTFADNGTFNIHAFATLGGQTLSSNTLAVNVRNIAPAVTIAKNTDLSAGANQVLNLTASDPGLLDTISWSINWGDGIITTSSGLTPQVSHTYPNSTGNFVVTVTATDKDGGIGTATQYLVLNNAGPAITLSGAGSTPEGSTYNLDFSASGTGASTISGWTINWGDGLTDTFDAGDSSASHLYADNGARTITVSAAYDGGISSESKSLTVTNVAPTLTLGGASVSEASSFTLLLGSSDPGNDHMISWMINWGDGAMLPVAGTATSASHTYADDRIYNIIVTANDEDGYYSSVKAVTITNAAPTLFVYGNSTVERGSTYNLNLLSADAGADAVNSWVIDWGDGSNQDVSEGFANLAHVYETEGQYTIAATATDEDGQWTANPLSLNVTTQTHNQTPDIDLDAPELIESTDWYQFTITLNYPGTSIVPDMSHVLVTGPNDFSAAAELVTLIGEDADTAFVATYRLAASDGLWENPDNGTYTISFDAGGLSSPAAGVIGTFQSAVPIPDSSAPTAVSSALTITSTIGASYNFTIHYADNSGVFLGDFDDTDLLVTGPNGFSSFAKFVSIDSKNNATYSIVAPGGAWNAPDNGTYTITLQEDAVHDAAGNSLAAGTVGTISVNIGDIAGNTLKAAKTLKITNTSKITLSNFVGSSDPDDYFKITFKTSVTLSTTLSGTGSSARLRVLNSKGRTLKTVSPGAFSINLNAGTYYLRLYSVSSVDTVYKAKLVTKPGTFSSTRIAA
ncbi:MAG TPA: PKD domain-containing protein [Tepidisphaeraceae bacterium]|nr:PKD domain-containing protein [Tepidisphaeraceae bacterium]